MVVVSFRGVTFRGALVVVVVVVTGGGTQVYGGQIRSSSSKPFNHSNCYNQ